MTDFLAEALARRPDGTALADAGRVWSYRELDDAVRAKAAELRAGGAAPGRTVAMVLPPSAEAVVAVHAVLRTGALLAPLSPTLTAAELREPLDVLDPVLVLGELPGGVPSGEPGGSPAAGDGPGWPAGPGGPVAVLWTSGTSGRPRGVLLAEGALRHSAAASGERLGLGPDDRWYASLGVAHVGGLALITRAALLGSALVATGPFDAPELNRLVDEGRVTHASLVPTMLARLLDDRRDRPPPPSLRCLLVGGAACPRPLLERALAAEMPVATTYGCTEATSQVATAPPDLVRRRPDTVGPPLEGVEVRVDGSGQLLVRGPTLALGLLGGGPLTDPDGWLPTGDLGELDGEGHLRITGRLSDRIVTGGVNVDPAEVEGVLMEHPGVGEAAVLGLPDDEWGERVTAAVTPLPVDGTPPGAEALREWARGRLSGAKAPKEVVLVPALPRNANGKVDRAALAHMLERHRRS